MTLGKPVAIVSVMLAGFLLCVGVGVCVSRGASDMEKPIPRISFSVGESETYSNGSVKLPSSGFQIHPSPALLLKWVVPSQAQELDHAFVFRNNVLIGTLDIEPKSREHLVDTESIKLRHGESFAGFQSGRQYLISIGTKNRPLPVDTDESQKPKNHLRINVK